MLDPFGFDIHRMLILPGRSLHTSHSFRLKKGVGGGSDPAFPEFRGAASPKSSWPKQNAKIKALHDQEKMPSAIWG